MARKRKESERPVTSDEHPGVLIGAEPLAAELQKLIEESPGPPLIDPPGRPAVVRFRAKLWPTDKFVLVEPQGENPSRGRVLELGADPPRISGGSQGGGRKLTRGDVVLFAPGSGIPVEGLKGEQLLFLHDDHVMCVAIQGGEAPPAGSH